MRIEIFEPVLGWRGLAMAVLTTLLATGINFLIAPYVAQANLVMVYLLGVAYVASRSTPQAGLLVSLLSVLTFDFCFVHPSGTLAVADVQYLITFAVMFVVSLLLSTLTIRLREQSAARNDATVKVQSERVRSDLLSAVSHELRTPLAGIEGSAGVLIAQPELSEQSLQLASTIQEESVRMGLLVRNLLDMTRVQGAVDLDLDWHTIDELAANAILRTESLFQNRVKLVVGKEPSIERVDGVLFEQVMVNLLENAARHAGSGSHVEVHVAQTEKWTEVEVVDDGPGIPVGNLGTIFERFESGQNGGFGLGLAICKSAIEAHGGSISVRNRPSGGAVFSIRVSRSRGESVD